MPAIHPAQLKKEIAALSALFDQPEQFHRTLTRLYEFYADRTRRPAQLGAPDSIIPAYHLPQPVMRLVNHALAPLVLANPMSALPLIDRLWTALYLEERLLAIHLLGALPAESAPAVLERITKWAQPNVESELITALFSHGIAQLKNTHISAILELIQTCLESGKQKTQRLGLNALQSLITDPTFENLPQAFTMLSPLVHQPPTGLRPTLLDLLRSAARRSPQETAFFMRQSYTLDAHPSTAWLLRQLLPQFPPETQERLRTAIKG